MPKRVPKVTVTCEICATEWQVKPSRAKQNNAITCSRECLGKLRAQNIIKYRGSAETRIGKCDHCGATIERKPSHLAKYETNYCGRECKAAAQVGLPKVAIRNGEWLPCGTCGVEVWRTPATRQANTYCSIRCSSKDKETRASERPGSRGELHWRWLGGRSSLPYMPGWTPSLRRAIRRRDGNRCGLCDIAPEKPGILVVHHIDRLKVNHDPSNLVTLCRSCHVKLHCGSIADPFRVPA